MMDCGDSQTYKEEMQFVRKYEKKIEQLSKVLWIASKKRDIARCCLRRGARVTMKKRLISMLLETASRDGVADIVELLLRDERESMQLDWLLRMDTRRLWSFSFRMKESIPPHIMTTL